MLTINVTRDGDKVIYARVMTDAQTAEHYRDRTKFKGAENRNDWKSFAAAQAVAAQLEGFIAIDQGSNVSPRWDIIRQFKLGDEVSYGFNGDSYPCGAIVSISKSGSVITAAINAKDKGSYRRFYRRGQSGIWKNGGTWTLMLGHHYRQNPSF